MPPYTAPGPPSGSFATDLRTPHQKRERLDFLRRSVLRDQYLVERIEEHLPTRYQKFALLNAVHARDGYVQLVRPGAMPLRRIAALVLRRIDPALAAQYATLQTDQQRRSFVHVNIDIDNPSHQQEMKRFLCEVFDGTAVLPGGAVNRCSNCWKCAVKFHVDGTIRRCKQCAKQYFLSVKHTNESLDRRCCGFPCENPPMSHEPLRLRTDTTPFQNVAGFPIFFELEIEETQAKDIYGAAAWERLLDLPLATLKQNWLVYAISSYVEWSASIDAVYFQGAFSQEVTDFADSRVVLKQLHQSTGTTLDLYCPLDAYGFWAADTLLWQDFEVNHWWELLWDEWNMDVTLEDFRLEQVRGDLGGLQSPQMLFMTGNDPSYRPCHNAYARMILLNKQRITPYGGVPLDWCDAMPITESCYCNGCMGLQPAFSTVDQAFILEAHYSECNFEGDELDGELVRVFSRYRTVLTSMIRREAMDMYQDCSIQPWREWIELICEGPVVDRKKNLTTLGLEIRASAPFNQDYQNIEAWDLGFHTRQKARFMVHLGAEEYWRTFMISPLFARLTQAYLKDKRALILVPNAVLSQSLRHHGLKDYTPGWIEDACKLPKVQVQFGAFDAQLVSSSLELMTPSKRIAIIKWNLDDILQSANAIRKCKGLSIPKTLETVCMKDVYDNSAERLLETRTKAI
ncbi:hypothetical protein AC579_5281 [Pseudocercospora musae]|uniref:Uncharacterized protein n=1 Tax=Pseudocercospora musae TaxID=113226 RepID=A0A139IPW7_9PEZI|nr:hypothetical protein AC579_5281 [Pseudocercospora musae]